MLPDGATARYDSVPECVGVARRFVVGNIDRWDLSRFSDDAALCAAELATNVILHAHTPFTISLRRLFDGVRIEIHDDRPDRLPIPVPYGIEAFDLGTTGRGLRLLTGVASRWGYFTTEIAKTVWVELSDRRPPSPPAPLVEIANRHSAGHGPGVKLIDMPVRTALASGVQIDDVLRQLQLDPDLLNEEDQATFFKLLERSAPPRLIGRQAAFRAAGQGLEYFSLELTVSAEEAVATVELTRFLEQRVVPSREEGTVSTDVGRFRGWLREEVSAQQGGAAPTPYPYGS
jgi:hypothetical protein